MVTYTPHSIDTSNIHLNEDLNNLVDFLAKNTHENWANERIKEGWKYGQKRNDIKKEHPCLVSYEALPESEKEHDRIVVKELLKTIVLLGFRIEKEKIKD
jgi:ryanodine receptor 2